LRQEFASILTSDLHKIADEIVFTSTYQFQKTTQYPQMCTLSTAMILMYSTEAAMLIMVHYENYIQLPQNGGFFVVH
jgi:hypothetical protein